MKELITREQADVFLLIAPLALAVLGIGLGVARRNPAAIAIGIGGGLIGVLWRVFNAIAERLGIDSVANLAVNAALFGAVGLVFGLGLRRWVPYPGVPVGGEPPDDEPEADPSV